jgi:hypothetical protein
VVPLYMDGFRLCRATLLRFWRTTRFVPTCCDRSADVRYTPWPPWLNDAVDQWRRGIFHCFCLHLVYYQTFVDSLDGNERMRN